jgi:hypothetical protein
MQKFVFATLLLCYFLISCHKEDRVKPVQLENVMSGNSPYIRTFNYSYVSKIDSNGNGYVPYFEIQAQALLLETTKFRYIVYLDLSSVGYSQMKVMTSDWLIGLGNVSNLAVLKVNSDSVLKSIGELSAYVKPILKIEDQYGKPVVVAQTTSSNFTYSTGQVTLSYLHIETKEEDVKYQPSFSASFPQTQDQNKNYFQAISSQLHFWFYPAPVKAHTYFAKVLYTNDPYSSSKTFSPFAKTDTFTLNQTTSDLIASLQFEIDTSQLSARSYSFKVELYESSSAEKISEDNFQSGIESMASDSRTFSLNKFSLVDTVDIDKDGFPSSYAARFQVSTSDSVDLPLFAEISYSIYGLDTYSSYSKVLWNSQQEASFVMAGNTFLPQGYYDFKIELYLYDPVTAQSAGNVLATFSPVNNSALQAIRLEKISEDK